MAAPPSRAERRRQRAAAFRERARRLEERAQAERRQHESVDAAFEMVDRDGEVAGGIIAGALAYRFFIWLLPLALVAVAGLGIAADSANQSPESTAEDLGLDDFVSGSIASAASSPNRWYALLVGLPVLLFVTRSVLRVLIGAHRLVWAEVRAAAPRPTAGATLRLLVLLVALGAASVAASAVRAWSGGFGVLSILLIALPYAAIWLVVSLRLPHRDAPAIALVPGALLFGLGLELLHVFGAYVLEPYAINKQGTYGALGAAAALLFAIFLVSRLIVAAAILNATLWDRRVRADTGVERPVRGVG
ncbi:MAG TPA: hypothetical protein VF236_05875 [Gaiellaceae bacterium]